MYLSHFVFTVWPCLIHICHAMPMPCSNYAVLVKATAQHICQETACGLPARVRLLPATMWSSLKIVIRSIPISDAGGQCETKQRLSWTRKSVVAACYKKMIHQTVGLAVQIFPATTWTSTKDTALSEHGRGMAWTGHRRGMAWAWHTMCESTYEVKISLNDNDNC